MITIPDELLKVLREKWKLGEHARPVCRVEVDRLAFIPGEVEELSLIVPDAKKVTTVERKWIQVDQNGNALGESVADSSDFVFPAEGYSHDADITSHFGDRDGRAAAHKGIDIGCPVGTNIRAVWSGKVLTADSRNLYDGAGKHVVIQHANGILTRSLHLSKLFVRAGQEVKQGAVIGLSGNTGDVRGAAGRPTGTYEDPSSERSRGVGAHLHLEILVPNDAGEAIPVNPYPYLFGQKKMYGSIRNTGAVVDEGHSQIRLGNPLLSENFASRFWHLGSAYSALSRNFESCMSVVFGSRPDAMDSTGGDAVFKLKKGESVSFTVQLPNMGNPAVLDAWYSTDFAERGAELRVYVNDKLAVCKKKFAASADILEELRNQYIPQAPSATSRIKFEIRYDGDGGGEFSFHKFRFLSVMEIPEWLKTKFEQALENPNSQPNGYWEEQEIEDTLLYNRTDTLPLQVGTYVYMDTLILDNVVSCEIDDQYESESNAAHVTISNPKGYYSPDYNPWLFQEQDLPPSPFSYQINGARVGVLSENTPIRIYMGYGLNLVRMFTGLIDRVDQNGDAGTLTIYARDMYKRILEKVLTEDKMYPRELDQQHADPANPPLDNAPAPVDYQHLSRKQKIAYKAQQYAAEFDVDDKLALAIACHETALGTAGAGREASGSFICGYGVPDSGRVQSQYAGIDRQMYFVCKRIREALQGRPSTLDNIKYLWAGGDLGRMQYSSDPKWPEGVWASYQAVQKDAELTARYFKGTAAGITPTPELKEQKAGAAPWLKSAIIQDLVAHAKLFGWRRNEQDLQYLDAVIEETYIIELDQNTGKVVKATGNEGEFLLVDLESTPTVHGWMNGFANEPIQFEAWHFKVGEAIRQILKDTNYRSYCDRYGTYRLEKIRLNKPIAGTFTEGENLIATSKSVDFSRGRSHLVIADKSNQYGSYLDSDILNELKGEVRSALISVGWAKSDKQKAEIARRMFWDIKRLCRTLSVAVPGDPTLEVLDRLYIISPNTMTRDTYMIKGIKTQFSKDGGWVTQLDLTWSGNGYFSGDFAGAGGPG